MSFLDHFTGAALNGRWTGVTAGGGAITVTDGYAQCANSADGDVAFIYYGTPLDKTVSQLWMICFDRHAIGTLSGLAVYILNKATAPAADTGTNINAQEVLSSGYQTDASVVGLDFAYVNAAGTKQHWNGAGAAWSSTVHNAAQPIQSDDYYILGIEIDADGGNSRFRMLQWAKHATSGYTFDQGLRLFAVSDWVNWSGVRTPNNLWLVLGNPKNTFHNGTFRFEWVRFANGKRQHAWANQKTNVAALYNIRHFWTYDYEAFVPEDRGTTAIAVGGGGTWDVNGTKGQMALLDGNTYYVFYTGQNASGTFQIGYASGSDPNSLTKYASNPILAAGSAPEQNVYDAWVVKDLSAPDNTQLWKMLYTCFDGTNYRIGYATAPAPSGPWTRRGIVLDIGSGGDPDAIGAAGPVVFFHAGQWEVWYSGLSASGAHNWSVCRAYGADLASLIKDMANNPYIPGKVDAVQDMTANLTGGRTVSMSDTTGFEEDALVLIDDDSNADHYTMSRIRKIVANTSLELYHGIDGFLSATPTNIRQLNAGGVGIEDIRMVNGIWYFYVSLFAIYGTHASYSAFCENIGVYASTNLADKPKSMKWMATPSPTRGFNGNNEESTENLTVVTAPIDRNTRLVYGARHFPRR